MIDVVVVDDHPVLRHGVALMLETQADIRVVAAVSNTALLVREVIEQALATAGAGASAL